MGGYTLRPGDVFVGYTIERVLGAGGMGAVYLAKDPRLPRRTALKLLDRNLTADDDVRVRFELEADHASRLEHPNIVAIFDRGRDGDQDWIAMQYVPGTDASEAVRDRPMDPERAVHIITETAKALDYAHENGVLHRDVKPANILLGNAGSGQPERVVLTDFGIAKALNDTHDLTKSGSLVATLLYAAPEVFEGIRLDGRSDVYSLGCTLFRLITGRVPYPGPDMLAIVRGHLEAPIPSPSALRPELPRAFDDVIRLALGKNRDNRTPNCIALAQAARRALAVPTVQIPQGRYSRTQPTAVRREVPYRPPQPPRPPLPNFPADNRRPRRLPIAFAAAVLVLIGLAAVVAFVYWPQSNDGPAQSVLAFSGLDYPVGVAVSATGDVLVADSNNNRIVKLTAGADTQTVLPFTGLDRPTGVAINAAGDVFVTDTKNNRVLKLAAGESDPTALPFTDLAGPVGLVVTARGDVFIADNNNDRVVALPAGANRQTEIPFAGLAGPTGITANAAGDLIVADTDNKRVLLLRSGSTSQTTLPFTGLASPTGVAVHITTGDIVVTDNKSGRVVSLPRGGERPTTLPFTDLSGPIGVAVSEVGELFVTDNSRVLKLPGALTNPS
ncbi:serine/threonine-protein kinase PknD [Antrihabitans spumae]|uniref:non-specific serine/threonine protein kinase n=1 Tax=Antrihabitans spumae TaxID=3373370 RepID=A0ABW7K625_9NOCA